MEEHELIVLQRFVLMTAVNNTSTNSGITSVKKGLLNWCIDFKIIYM